MSVYWKKTAAREAPGAVLKMVITGGEHVEYVLFSTTSYHCAFWLVEELPVKFLVGSPVDKSQPWT